MTYYTPYTLILQYEGCVICVPLIYVSYLGLQDYKDTLQTQVLKAAGSKKMAFGAELSERHLRDFQEEQIGQLYELMLESTKPTRQFDVQEDGPPK